MFLLGAKSARAAKKPVKLIEDDEETDSGGEEEAPERKGKGKKT